MTERKKVLKVGRDPEASIALNMLKQRYPEGSTIRKVINEFEKKEEDE